MAVRRLHPDQPSSFAFTPENDAWAAKILQNFPDGKQASGVIPLLWRAQEQHHGWLPEPAIRLVAEKLDMPFIRVFEVATFYTMFQLSPVGRKAHVQVCGTTPCMLRGSEDLISVCKRRIASAPQTLSADGDFSWEEVECLGSCANAPMVQIWSDTYEDLTAELFEAVLDGFASGTPPQPGSQTGRTASCPSGGQTTLKKAPDPARYHQTSETAGETGAAALGIVTPAVGGAEAKPDTSGQAAAPGGQPQVSPKPGSGADTLKQDVRPADLVDDEQEPELFAAPRADRAPDDLKRISGVGPKLEGTLNEMGIYYFDQVASWTANEVAWVDARLNFKGRIERENWIDQAKDLAQG